MLNNAIIKAYVHTSEAYRRLKQDERGATLIEYSILIGLITVAVIVTVGTVGTWIATQWTDLDAELI
jgi:pilus assembly protein Flp/PilA